MDPQKLKLVSLELVKEALDKDIPIPLKTFGLSMGDTIRSGEWVLVRKVTPEKLRFGDIVIFQDRTHFVCHRLIRKKKINGTLCVLTKGDSHIAPDRYVPAADVLARVVGLKKGDILYRLDGLKGRWINTLLGGYSLIVTLIYERLPFLKGFRKKHIDRVGMLFVWCVYSLIRFPTKLMRKVQK